MPSSVLSQMEEKMDAAIQAFSRNLATVRAGRANPAILDNVFVDYYGATTPLNQLATIGAPEPRLLVISPFDKSSIGEMEKAIQKADLGLAPSSDGDVIRINIPALTEDRRKELTKVVGKFAEESRVNIRNHRRDANDQLKKLEKDATITEDELRSNTDAVQKKTDEFIQKIDELATNKEAEIMEV